MSAKSDTVKVKGKGKEGYNSGHGVDPRRKKISIKKASEDPKELANLEILVGMDEGGREVVRRYTSVDREEASRQNSPQKPRGEMGGTGVEPRRRQELEMYSSSRERTTSDSGGETGFCQKPGCKGKAYGRCYWRNPCSLPEKRGGCNQLYCELHSAQFSNFRKFQCCTACQTNFVKARNYRQKARLTGCAILTILAVLVSIAFTSYSFTDKTSDDDMTNLPISDAQTDVRKILEGEHLMTPSTSEEWGKKAHAKTNAYRTANGLAELEWSSSLHRVAYQKNQDVARGIIPIGKSNFVSLLSQTQSFYEPDFQVNSLSEKSVKIVDISFNEDYVEEWANNWTVDYVLEVKGPWTAAATSVYFVKETREVLFTQLLAQIEDSIPP